MTKTKKEGGQGLNRLPRSSDHSPRPDRVQEEFGQALQHMLGVLGCHVEGQGLDLVILTGPLQLRLFYNCKRHHQLLGNAHGEMSPLSFQKSTSSCWSNRA